MSLGALTSLLAALVVLLIGALLNRRVRLLSRVSGAFLIGGGAWLALSRSR